MSARLAEGLGTRRAGRRMRNEAEGEAAGEGIGFLEPHRDGIAKVKAPPAGPADERMARGIVAVIVARQGAYGEETVGSGLVERDKKAKALHAVHRALEFSTDTVRKIGSDVAVVGIAFGRHGPALRFRDGLPEIVPPGRVVPSDAARRPGAEQGPMDEKVGIAPDRRGEVRVAAQGQAEM